ncbi:class I SAM-dependent methyltransferase [Streptomyces sp. FIT100]|uniref:class I SAM-dependent methyltransferase n=1 Tax=Streptomyces sp. FIT100 TaxID=2837956 RepID=UPI0021C8E704|nr:class I SAM-dependent methyltransferase [Streptomyces sp. FIT100]UUN29848.1 methyltransferase domain-containing protein [Streptomyces sp. FIT100]
MELTDYLQLVADRQARTNRYAEAVPAFYGIVTPVYRHIWTDSFHFTWFNGEESLLEAQLHQQQRLADDSGFRPGMRVLDVGCGIGGPTKAVAVMTGAHLTGLNITPAQIDVAARECDSTNRHLVDFAVGDMMKIPFPAQHFDGVCTFEAICHAPEKRGAYAEIARVLRDGGVFIGMDWFVPDGLDRERYDEVIEPMCQTVAIPDLISVAEFRRNMAAFDFTVDFVTPYDQMGDIKPNFERFADAKQGVSSMKSGAQMEMMIDALDLIRKAIDRGDLILSYFKARKTGAA